MGKSKITFRWMKEGNPMLLRVKLAASELVANPAARTVFILAMLVVAALVGGAPYDHGGGG